MQHGSLHDCQKKNQLASTNPHLQGFNASAADNEKEDKEICFLNDKFNQNIRFSVFSPFNFRARIVSKPEALQLPQLLQVQDLGEVTDVVLPYVEFLQHPAVLEVGQRANVVDATKIRR
jgi:hypothetical protein